MIMVLSLGAGVQSSTVLRLAIHGEIERPDHVIFADTGWEPRAVYEHLAILEVEMAAAGMNLHKVFAGDIRGDTLKVAREGIRKGSTVPSMPFFTIDQHGNKAIQMRQCTRGYKISPLNKKVKELCGVPRKTKGAIPCVEMWFGISTDELRRTRMSKDWWTMYHYPLIELGMSRSDCVNWNQDMGFATPPRSACVACPYRGDGEWRHLAATSPEEFEDACKFDDAIRVREGINGESFVHRLCVPLREVDFSTPEDHGQINMFRDNECAGMCGV